MNINATILGQAIAFILFVAFCMKYVWPPLMSAIEKRQKLVAKELALAERAKKDLKIAEANATGHLKQAKEKAQKIIDQANQYREQILQEAKKEAEQERTQIINQAQIQIDYQIKCAHEELRKEISTHAIACAEKIIESSLDEDVKRNIIYKVIAEI